MVETFHYLIRALSSYAGLTTVRLIKLYSTDYSSDYIRQTRAKSHLANLSLDMCRTRALLSLELLTGAYLLMQLGFERRYSNQKVCAAPLSH